MDPRIRIRNHTKMSWIRKHGWDDKYAKKQRLPYLLWKLVKSPSSSWSTLGSDKGPTTTMWSGSCPPCCWSCSWWCCRRCPPCSCCCNCCCCISCISCCSSPTFCSCCSSWSWSPATCSWGTSCCCCTFRGTWTCPWKLILNMFTMN